MANHGSYAYMMDSMIMAVDEGFSRDGIMSIPGAGLEDTRFSLTDKLRDRIDDLSRGAAKAASVLKHIQPHPHNFLLVRPSLGSRRQSDSGSSAASQGSDTSEFPGSEKLGHSTAEKIRRNASWPGSRYDDDDMVYGCFPGFSRSGRTSPENLRGRVEATSSDLPENPQERAEATSSDSHENLQEWIEV